MTTATERHDEQLAAIKARHAALGAELMTPNLPIGHQVKLSGSPTMAQLGLSNVFADSGLRLWCENGEGVLMLVHDPFLALRAATAEGNMQAAQGFKAKE